MLEEKHSLSARSEKDAKSSVLLRALTKAGCANASTLCLSAAAAAAATEHAGAPQGSQFSEVKQDRRDFTGDAVLPQGTHGGTAEDDGRGNAETLHGRLVKILLNRARPYSLQPVLCGFWSPVRQRLYLLQPHAPHSLADLLRFITTSLAHDTGVRLLLFQVQLQTHINALSCMQLSMWYVRDLSCKLA